MNPLTSSCRAFFLLLPLTATVSCSITDCSTKNESDDALRRVPVVSPDAVQDGPSSGAAGRAEYTIDATSGEFTVTHQEEAESGFLGIRLDLLDKDSAQDLDLEPYVGVRVRKVEAGTPASDGGILRGDVIVKFGQKDAVSPDQVSHLIEATRPGDPVELTVRRGGKTLQLTVLVGSERRFETKKAPRTKLPILDDRKRTGLKLAELTDDVRRIVVGPGVPDKGLLVVDVMPGGPGFYADLRPRDHIALVGGTPVPTIDAYMKAMESAPPGSSARFAFDRSGRRMETVVGVVEDALDEGRFDFPLIYKYRDKPDHTEVDVLLGLLYVRETCRSVRVEKLTPRNATTTKWGLLLDLLCYEGTSRGKKMFRIAWVIPIVWGG